MQPADLGLSHIFLALDHHVHLVSDICQAAQDLLVSNREVVNGIFDAGVLAELPHQGLHFPQIVPGDLREQVMHSLELETAMDEI